MSSKKQYMYRYSTIMCVCTQFQAFCNKLKSTELYTHPTWVQNKLELNLVFHFHFQKKKKCFVFLYEKDKLKLDINI
jgi:hypothetical protein